MIQLIDHLFDFDNTVSSKSNGVQPNFSRSTRFPMGDRGRDLPDPDEESLEETNLDGDFAAGVDLVFVWVERRQQGELRGLHAVPVVAVAVHGHLPGAELRENAPTATGARGHLAVVLVRGGGREEGRGGCQDDQEPRHAGTRGSRLRDRAEPEALSVVGDSESLKVRLVSHTAAAAAAACRLENEEASVAGLVGAWKFRICP